MAKKKNTWQIFDLNYWSSDLILQNLPFVMFLSFLAVLYIANAHYAERNVRKIQVLQRDIKELRWHYMSLEAEIMYNSKRSEMVKNVQEEGLRPINEKPKKIVAED